MDKNVNVALFTVHSNKLNAKQSIHFTERNEQVSLINTNEILAKPQNSGNISQPNTHSQSLEATEKNDEFNVVRTKRKIIGKN